jgi:hypothetical protein
VAEEGLQYLQILQAIPAAFFTFFRCTRLTMQGGVPDDPTTMSSPGSGSRSSTRAETPPFVGRAGPGRWGRHGGCVPWLKEGGLTATPHLTTHALHKLTMTGPQHPSTC